MNQTNCEWCGEPASSPEPCPCLDCVKCGEPDAAMQGTGERICEDCWDAMREDADDARRDDAHCEHEGTPWGDGDSGRGEVEL